MFHLLVDNSGSHSLLLPRDYPTGSVSILGVFAHTLSVTHPSSCMLCTSSETTLKDGTCSKMSRKEQDIALPDKRSIRC